MEFTALEISLIALLIVILLFFFIYYKVCVGYGRSSLKEINELKSEIKNKREEVVAIEETILIDIINQVEQYDMISDREACLSGIIDRLIVAEKSMMQLAQDSKSSLEYTPLQTIWAALYEKMNNDELPKIENLASRLDYITSKGNKRT